MIKKFSVVALTLSLLLVARLVARSPAEVGAVQLKVGDRTLTTRCEPPAGSLSRLSKAQQNAFLKSQDAFIARRCEDATAQLRDLIGEVKDSSVAYTALAERAAEAAIEAGQRDYAVTLLKPIEQRDAGDCLARTLLARAYAEDGRSEERDSVIAALSALHQKDPKSPAGKLDGFDLEKHRTKRGGYVGILYALRPFGPHNTHIYSEVYDPSNKRVAQIELDSDDGDQVYFREKYPDLAAKGERRFSLDVYAPEHALVRFFEGRPRYDDVRTFILEFAERVTATLP